MRTLITSLVLLIFSMSAMSSMEIPLETTTDYQAALKLADENDKSVLLLFVMTSCGHCQALKKEVLSSDAFKAFAEESLITVAYNYQQRRELPSETRAQMKSLMDTHGIEGFPAIILLSPNEKVLLKSEGYGGSPAEKVINLFQERIAEAGRM